MADIPFLAGDIAAAAGIPIIAITNFTWDWIYEPYFNDRQDLLREMGATWKIITEDMLEPKGIEIWRLP